MDHILIDFRYHCRILRSKSIFIWSNWFGSKTASFSISNFDLEFQWPNTPLFATTGTDRRIFVSILSVKPWYYISWLYQWTNCPLGHCWISWKTSFKQWKESGRVSNSYITDRERHLANHLERHLVSIILETPLSQKRNKVCLVKNKGPIRQSSCGKQYQLLKMVTRHQFHKFNGLQR